jgi:hypothetical protein
MLLHPYALSAFWQSLPMKGAWLFSHGLTLLEKQYTKEDAKMDFSTKKKKFIKKNCGRALSHKGLDGQRGRAACGSRADIGADSLHDFRQRRDVVPAQ